MQLSYSVCVLMSPVTIDAYLGPLENEISNRIAERTINVTCIRSPQTLVGGASHTRGEVRILWIGSGFASKALFWVQTVADLTPILWVVGVTTKPQPKL